MLCGLMMAEYDACFVSETGEHEYDSFLVCGKCGFDLKIEVEYVEEKKEG